MKKRMLPMLLVLSMVLTWLSTMALAIDEAEPYATPVSNAVWDGSVADSYAGGSGTSGDPYLIATAEQLAKAADDTNNAESAVATYYRLTSDIYLNDISNWDLWTTIIPTNSWMPIGSVSHPFKGSFDGNGHVIFGAYINSTQDYQGIFGYADSSNIWNLGSECSYIGGKNYVGGIVGCSYMSGNTIKNCYNTGTVSGNSYVGGITGQMKYPNSLFLSGDVYTSYNLGKITGTSYVGGIVGNGNASKPQYCYNVGEVTGVSCVGGIAGETIDVNNCWNAGTITGETNVGGIMGKMLQAGGFAGGTISGCFNAGKVYGASNTGGIAGYTMPFSGFYRAYIKDCYNTGSISATSNKVAGIVGYPYGTIITNCYNAGICSFSEGKEFDAVFNQGASDGTGNLYYLAGCCGKDYHNGWPSYVVEKSSSEMRESAFVNTLGTAWQRDTEGYNSGYPILGGINYSVYAEYMEKSDISKGMISFANVKYSVGIGEEILIMATIPDSSDFQPDDIVWTSNNESIASIVSSSALISNSTTAMARIRGISDGTTAIVISTTDGRTASCSITSGVADDDLNPFDRFVNQMPKLSEDQATSFLKFVYGVKGEETVSGLSQEDMYRLLTGDVSKYMQYEKNEALTMLKADIVIFSSFVRARTAAWIEESSSVSANSAKTMVDLLMSTVPSTFDPTLGIIDDYTGKLTDYLESGLVTLFSSVLAHVSGIYVTELQFENLELAFDSYGQIIGSIKKMDQYLTYFSAAAESVSFIGNEELAQIYAYFNTYITQRPNFDSADNEIFRTTLTLFYEGNLLGSSGLGVALQWVGVDSWRDHKDLLDSWGEYLCSLEEYASTLYSMRSDVEVSGCDTIYGGMAYSISTEIPPFATARYGDTNDDYPFMTPPTYTEAGSHTIYYCITAPHYEIIRGSATVNIEKATRALTVTSSSNLTLMPNETEKITYAIDKDIDGSSIGAVVFSSSNSSVATIDENGIVVAHSPGISYITISLPETTNYHSAQPQTVIVNVTDNNPLPITYVLTVNNGAGSGDYAAGTQVSITANTAPESKEFDQWTTNNGGTFADASSISTTFTMPAGDVTVMATYRDIAAPPVPTTYLINFDPNSGTVDITSMTTGVDGKLPSLPIPTYNGYTFNGWFTSLIDGDQVTVNTVFTSDATVYAQWTYNSGISSGNNWYPPTDSTTPTTYRITVPAVSGGTVNVSPTSAKKGDTVMITVMSVSGYELNYITITGKNGDNVPLTDHGNGKYVFIMPSGNVTLDYAFKLIETDSLNPPTVSFIDVVLGVYYYDAVAWAVAQGITNGTTTGTFSPDALCTRGQIVTFLWRAAGSPSVSGNNPFTDVQSGDYWYDAVLWAVSKGITTGTSATTFSPNDTCTRSQAVTFLYRNAGSPAVTTSAAFTDVVPGAYYSDAVTWALAKNITNGTTATTFNPDDRCTRGQIVTFLYRNLGE